MNSSLNDDSEAIDTTDKKLIKKNSSVAVAGDFRPSTGRILKACAKAIEDFGLKVDYCGIIPTQAVSLYGFKRDIPSVMVTGSHIPSDRNGIKFNLPDGEILKKDEQKITDRYQRILAAGGFSSLFGRKDSLKKIVKLPKINQTPEKEYIERYLEFFKPNLLKDKKIVVYQQSTVIRDIMVEVLKKLGARVIPVGRSEKFIPIDNEAISIKDFVKVAKWARKFHSDAVVSADGDGDRPMLFDETGKTIHGDFLGIICSTYLRADSVSATVSCTTALEKSKKFKKINRTKIGSPYVIEAMQEDEKRGFKRIVSYETNGGFLTQSDIRLNNKRLRALPTRDSMLPILCTLALAVEKKLPLSKLVRQLPQRFVYSQSIKGFPTERSRKILQKISKSNLGAKKAAKELFGLPAEVKKIDFLDGARMYLANGEIVHVRPSGNSPELRAYIEADNLLRAKKICEQTLKKLIRLA